MLLAGLFFGLQSSDEMCDAIFELVGGRACRPATPLEIRGERVQLLEEGGAEFSEEGVLFVECAADGVLVGLFA